MPRTRELRIQLWSKCHHIPGTAIQMIRGMKVRLMWSWKSARGFRQRNRHCITMRWVWYDKILLEAFCLDLGWWELSEGYGRSNVWDLRTSEIVRARQRQLRKESPGKGNNRSKYSQGKRPWFIPGTCQEDWFLLMVMGSGVQCVVCIKRLC